MKKVRPISYKIICWVCGVECEIIEEEQPCFRERYYVRLCEECSEKAAPPTEDY